MSPIINLLESYGYKFNFVDRKYYIEFDIKNEHVDKLYSLIYNIYDGGPTIPFIPGKTYLNNILLTNHIYMIKEIIHLDQDNFCKNYPRASIGYLCFNTQDGIYGGHTMLDKNNVSVEFSIPLDTHHLIISIAESKVNDNFDVLHKFLIEFNKTHNVQFIND